MRLALVLVVCFTLCFLAKESGAFSVKFETSGSEAAAAKPKDDSVKEPVEVKKSSKKDAANAEKGKDSKAVKAEAAAGEKGKETVRLLKREIADEERRMRRSAVAKRRADEPKNFLRDLAQNLDSALAAGLRRANSRNLHHKFNLPEPLFNGAPLSRTEGVEEKVPDAQTSEPSAPKEESPSSPPPASIFDEHQMDDHISNFPLLDEAPTFPSISRPIISNLPGDSMMLNKIATHLQKLKNEFQMLMKDLDLDSFMSGENMPAFMKKIIESLTIVIKRVREFLNHISNLIASIQRKTLSPFVVRNMDLQTLSSVMQLLEDGQSALPPGNPVRSDDYFNDGTSGSGGSNFPGQGTDLGDFLRELSKRSLGCDRNENPYESDVDCVIHRLETNLDESLNDLKEGIYQLKRFVRDKHTDDV